MATPPRRRRLHDGAVDHRAVDLHGTGLRRGGIDHRQPRDDLVVLGRPGDEALGVARAVDVLVVGAGGGLDVRPAAPQREGDEPVGRVDGEVQRQRPLADGPVGERSRPGLVEVAVRARPARVIPDTTRRIEIRDASAGSRVDGDGQHGRRGRPGCRGAPRPAGSATRPASIAAWAAPSSAHTEARSRSPSSPGPIAPANTARSPGREADPRSQRVTQGGVEPRADRAEPDQQQDGAHDLPSCKRAGGLFPTCCRPCKPGRPSAGARRPLVASGHRPPGTAPGVPHDCHPNGHDAAPDLPRRAMGRVGRPARDREPRPPRRARRRRRSTRPRRSTRRRSRPPCARSRSPASCRPTSGGGSCARSARASERGARSWARRSRPRRASRSATRWSRWTGRRSPSGWAPRRRSG